VSGLLKRSKVKVLNGWGRFSDAKTCHVATAEGDIVVKAEHVVLAAGSVPVELPFLPFGGRVISSTEALALETLPKRLVIVGAGYIGLELGSALRKLGSEVAIVEVAPQILPLYDRELVEPVRQWLERNGVALHLQARATRLAAEGDGLVVTDKAGAEAVLPADNILVTVGRRPAVDDWGLEDMAVERDGAFVKVDDRCATSTLNVWAIGDLVGEPMLAHKASAQGEMVAEIIAGIRRRFDPAAIPAICFTDPEIVSVGLSPAQAGDGAIVGVFPFQANGRALSMDAGADGGFVRVVAQADNHLLLGVQAVGQHVSELSAAFTQALEMGAVLEDLAGVIAAHPSVGEAFHEASLRALGHAIHI
jgi:dihydrolipoamide dehydrogenase